MQWDSNRRPTFKAASLFRRKKNPETESTPARIVFNVRCAVRSAAGSVETNVHATPPRRPMVTAAGMNACRATTCVVGTVEWSLYRSRRSIKACIASGGLTHLSALGPLKPLARWRARGKREPTDAALRSTLFRTYDPRTPCRYRCRSRYSHAVLSRGPVAACRSNGPPALRWEDGC